MGAVTGAHDFLKMVTKAAISPPIKPGSSSPMARSGEVVATFHDQAAVAIAHISSKPVLLTVPLRVMVSPNATPSPLKVLSFNAGFEVFMSAILLSLFDQDTQLASGGQTYPCKSLLKF